MDTPVRKYQKQKDYQRHKLFRKMKRRRRAAIEQAKDAPMKQLRRKLKIPKFEDGKDDKPNVFQLADGTFVNSHNEPLEVLDYAGVEDPTKWTYVDKKGNRYTPKATRTLTEGEQFTQRQIENEQNTRPFEFTPYIEGANEGAAMASLMMGFPFNMAGSAYYGARSLANAYYGDYLDAALDATGAIAPAGSGILQRVKKLLPKEKTLITAENAANITPEQWTAAQDMAIARGDVDEAQRLRDLHFDVSAPNTKISNTVYHGTDKTFNQFDRNKIGTKTDYGVFGEGFYFSPTVGYARQYGDNIMPIYLNIENPYVGVDAGGILSSKYIPTDPEKVYQSTYKVMLKRGKNTEEALKIANRHKQNVIDRNRRAEEMRSKGYDGVFANTKQMNAHEYQFVAFNPEQIKSADAVTYADDGTRIPLGNRDNFKINDIRYDKSFDDLFSLPGASLKEKEIISYLQNAEPVPRDILRRPLSSLDEDSKVQRSVANGVNDAVKFLRSEGYKTRLKNLGYTGDEANYIIDNQIDNIRKADVVTLPKYNKMYSRHGMATPYRREDGTMGYQIALQPEKSLAYNPRVTAAHEAFHVGSNKHGIKDFTSLPQDIREHNASIRPIVNDDYDAKLVFEGLDDEELRARALEVLARSERANMPVMDYINRWGADPIPGKGPGILRNPNYDHNANDLRTYFTPESLRRYLEGVAGIAAPLVGGTALLSYNSLGQPIDTYKHGKDSGIHINLKNRGKFNALKKRTGKTTEQLTHSKNPLTRKRAIFAQNAKKWKH